MNLGKLLCRNGIHRIITRITLPSGGWCRHLHPLRTGPGGAVMSWLDDAACAGGDTNLFYPGKGTEGRAQARLVIRTYCATCPVRQECLNDAMRVEASSGQRQGIRGGLTHKQRAKLAKTKEKAA